MYNAMNEDTAIIQNNELENDYAADERENAVAIQDNELENDYAIH